MAEEGGIVVSVVSRQLKDLEIQTEEREMVAVSVKDNMGKGGPTTSKWQFYVFSISILLTISSYGGLMDLQSSINITGALGNNSLLLMSGTTIVFCLLFTPLVVVKLGAKLTLIISQICCLAYVVANFYPAPYTLLPGGVLLGIGEALLNTPALMYCTYYGRRAAARNMKPEHDMINRHVGYYSGFYQMNEIFSNLISFIILGIGKNIESHESEDVNSVNSFEGTPLSAIDSTSNSSVSTNVPDFTESVFASVKSSTVLLTQNSSSTPNTIENKATFPATSLNFSYYNVMFTDTTSPVSEFLPETEKYSMCSANDCYNEADFDSIIDHYVPMSTTAFYVMIAAYTLIGISALPLMMLVPKLQSYTPVEEDSDSEDEKEWKPLKACSGFRLVWANLRGTFLHLVDTRQLLITPFTLYNGLFISFVSSEINRAYVSCTVGVERIGIGMVAGGIMNVCVSFLFGIFAGRKHIRNFFIVAAISLDLALYVFCLYWIPTDDTVWLAYVIALLFGATDGVWSPFLDGIYAKYFPENEETAYTVQNVWTYVGLALTYGWTAVFCIRVKIYIQIAVLVVGICGVGAADMIQERKEARKV